MNTLSPRDREIVEAVALLHIPRASIQWESGRVLVIKDSKRGPEALDRICRSIADICHRDAGIDIVCKPLEE